MAAVAKGEMTAVSLFLMGKTEKSKCGNRKTSSYIIMRPSEWQSLGSNETLEYIQGILFKKTGKRVTFQEVFHIYVQTF